jgi:hypothetical protein
MSNIALPFSYGVFKSYYSQHPSFKGQDGIAAVGTTTMVSQQLVREGIY